VTSRHRSALADARDRRASAAARVEAASNDHVNESLQAELASLDIKIADQQNRRRVLERARSLLEETRAAVARDHQPPVLREASRWLARLTEGRYHSITTAVDEARLDIHERDGGVWKPERLSRGTREQVFLALRLALVRDLGRHDVTLPVVMDDALVNFDDTRARSAARVLVEFLAEQGSDRQMLVLTCHAHVAEIFHEAGAHVRSLSDPAATWGHRPAPRIVAKQEPAPLPPAPTPTVIDEPPQKDLWPAEEFFFGRGRGAVLSTKAARRDPPAAVPKSPRRNATRHRRQRL
jgi:hypothetical protein